MSMYDEFDPDLADLVACFGYELTPGCGAPQPEPCVTIQETRHPKHGVALLVNAPESPTFSRALKRLRARYEPEGWYLKPNQRPALWAAIQQAFPGLTLHGPKGPVQIPRP